MFVWRRQSCLRLLRAGEIACATLRPPSPKSRAIWTAEGGCPPLRQAAALR